MHIYETAYYTVYTLGIQPRTDCITGCIIKTVKLNIFIRNFHNHPKQTSNRTEQYRPEPLPKHMILNGPNFRLVRFSDTFTNCE